jgi:hypothetical protein
LLIGAGAAAAAILVAAMTLKASVSSDNKEESACPAATMKNAERTRKILQMLNTDEEMRTVLQQQESKVSICFGDIPSGVLRTDGVFLLPISKSDASNAARTAHLMLHRIDLPPLDGNAVVKNTLSCDDFVNRIMDDESRAFALENRLLKGFGLEPGSDALSALRADYQSRCMGLRASLKNGTEFSYPR